MPLPTSRDEIVSFLDDYLDVQGIHDYGPMGLQVIGGATVNRVAVAVSASLASISQAAAQGAEMLIVHHGMLWDNESRVIGQMMRGRLKLLFQHDINLLGYHLCLDRHVEIGNNVLALQALGAKPIEMDSPIATVGYVGEFAEPVPWDELSARAQCVFGGEPTYFPSGPTRTSRLGLVTGGAGSTKYVMEAAARGCDTYLTGELTEPVPAVAAELGMNLIGAGHYNTEKLGIQAVGSLLEERFDVTATFIDVPNPL
jgi:dinuclear metal center YbgI/SA1388 family protein